MISIDWLWIRLAVLVLHLCVVAARWLLKAASLTVTTVPHGRKRLFVCTRQLRGTALCMPYRSVPEECSG